VSDLLDPNAIVRVQDLSLHAVRFNNEHSRVPIAFQGSVLGLLGRQHLARVSKKGTPAFSMATYKAGTTRGKRGVAKVTAVVLDFDHLPGDMAEEVHHCLDGYAHVSYTSYSHHADGPDDCCFRVILFCTRALWPREYAAVWQHANHLLGELADAKASDVARLWYMPSCPPERMAVAHLELAQGRLLDVDRILEAVTPNARSPRMGKARRAVAKGASIGTRAPVTKGGRNAHLISLAGTMRRRDMDEAAILAALREENAAHCSPLLGDDEICGIVQSVCSYDPSSPLVTSNRTDLGNAERLVAYAGLDLRYIYPWDSWLCWMGRVWERDVSGEILRRSRDTVRTTAAFASAIPDKEPRERLFRHALRTESAGKMQAMVALARPLLFIDPALLDQRPWLFNCGNGTLDLRRGTLRKHRRGDLLTKVSDVPYDPKATCPRWDAFLDRVMDGNDELITFLQRAVGYSLTGSTREQVLFLLWGIGANGKSTFVDIVRSLVGGYAVQAEFSTFLKQDSDSVRNDVARLVGSRFVAAVEAEGGRPLAEAMVKQMTGGDFVTARFLFKEYFEYKPTFKVWLAANHKPTIRGTDHGIWRRIRLIPFLVTIPEDERDPDLVSKLEDELPGILAWAVRGCLDWQIEGLGHPQDVRDATESFRDEMDALGGLLDECCVVEPSAVVRSSALYLAYKKWAEDNGERVMSKKAMAMRLTERGFQRFKGTRGARCWRGLRLQDEGEGA
jgi:P4 family phage/plasmid primase-like protien